MIMWETVRVCLRGWEEMGLTAETAELAKKILEDLLSGVGVLSGDRGLSY
jgi:hypothetical protein